MPWCEEQWEQAIASQVVAYQHVNPLLPYSPSHLASDLGISLVTTDSYLLPCLQSNPRMSWHGLSLATAPLPLSR